MRKIFAFFLAMVMLCLTACAPATSTQSEPTETAAPVATAPSETKTYNIIFTLATIPPVLAALDAIESGNETWALIERGKTYSGIETIENFYNAGFDPANNLSEGFTATELDSMVAKVKELHADDENVFFNFYIQDGTALLGAAIAANAGVPADQFHVYMVEDGTGAYDALNSGYVSGKTVDADMDQVYENYAVQVAAAKAEFEAVMSRTNNQIGDEPLWYNIPKAFALAALDNFTYYIQDEVRIIEILTSTGSTPTKLLSAFGVDGYDSDVEYTLNLKYQKIADGVSKLTAEQRTAYLTLMYGQYFKDTDAALTRTERAGEAAPAQKLVYIGTRHSGYPHFASNASYGIGGLAADAVVPASYAELDDKYKSPLLFAAEEDYTTFLNVINDTANYSEGISDEAKRLAQVACFNNYIDYIFNLKFTYAQYGEQYDLIMKGHPREVIGGWQEWGQKYNVTCADESIYCYDQLMDTALLAFHSGDSTGKFIGMVPYGTAAENLAFLGADLSICGLPSSTYNGYDTDVDVLFIMTETDQDIAGSGSAEVASQVSNRYELGNLLFTDAEGQEHVTVFYNTGNTFKTASAICEAAGDADGAAAYTALYEAWLNNAHSGAAAIDAQGFPVNE